MIIRKHLLAAILCLLLPLSASAEFKVGLVLTLSGPGADLGEAIKNSVELAKEDKPEAFKNIRFIYQDAQYDTKQAVSAFRKLRLQDQADLMFTWGLTFCQALAPIAETSGVPLVAECIDPHIGKDRKLIVRTLNTSDEYLAVQTSYLKAQSLNKIAILVAENPYTVEVLDALRRTLKPGQEISIEDHFLPSDADFAPTIIKLKVNPPDVIGVLLSTGQIGQFYKQARQLRMNLPSFGTNWFASESEIRTAEGGMEGAVFAMNAPLSAYVERYKARFGINTGLAFGAPAYEFARMVGEFYGGSPEKLSAEQIIGRLAGAGKRSGIATGDYQFVDHPQFGKYFQFPIVLRRVTGDATQVVQFP